MKNLHQLAEQLNLKDNLLISYGKDSYKLDINRVASSGYRGKLVLITAITPTKTGEGKTTTAISLTDSINRIYGQKAVACLREPSLGPVWGVKGGATGALKAKLFPEDKINLHFTGDIHAITATVNLIAAVIENHIYQGNELNIDPNNIVWKRCIDINDRSLRHITVAEEDKGAVPHKSQFVITVASELRSVLCISKNNKDFIERVNNRLFAYTKDNKPLYIKDLHISKAINKMMEDALLPNIVQTVDGSPVIIHGGPFANISIGTSSKIGTQAALWLSPVVIQEAGFGADLGAEKFIDIYSDEDIKPSLCVLVATIKALKSYSKEENKTDLELIQAGLINLEKHFNNRSKLANIRTVIAVNRFAEDTDNEINFVLNWALNKGIHATEINVAENNSENLARIVIELLKQPSPKISNLYNKAASFEERLKALCKNVYGCAVELSQTAIDKLNEYKKYGWDNFDLCRAKTPRSFSDNPKDSPIEFNKTIHIKDIWIYTGARLIVPIAGSIMLMPGLPKSPKCLDDNN